MMLRTRLTNLILHTTALIQKKKDQSLVSHAFSAIIDIFVIILLEIFLAVISIPLYTIYRNLGKNFKTRYRASQIIFWVLLLLSLYIVWRRWRSIAGF